MKKTFCLLSLAALLASCSNTAKKVVVMSKGDPDINTTDKHITSTDGSGHTERTFVLGGSSYQYKLTTPAGEGNVSFTDNGLYVVNVKSDTIIGSYQRYTDPAKANAVISQADLRQKIDSLHLLMEGKNVTPANRNFFLPPNTAARISDNTGAEVVGPYHQMISAAKVDGKDPEVYRFYSIKEIREMVTKMEALTGVTQQ